MELNQAVTGTRVEYTNKGKPEVLGKQGVIVDKRISTNPTVEWDDGYPHTTTPNVANLKVIALPDGSNPYEEKPECFGSAKCKGVACNKCSHKSQSTCCVNCPGKCETVCRKKYAEQPHSTPRVKVGDEVLDTLIDSTIVGQLFTVTETDGQVILTGTSKCGNYLKIRRKPNEFLAVGDRVRRGPTWDWYDQDGNGLGTVSKLYGIGSEGEKKHTLQVKWDACGTTNSYRMNAEYQDLELVLDEPKEEALDCRPGQIVVNVPRVAGLRTLAEQQRLMNRQVSAMLDIGGYLNPTIQEDTMANVDSTIEKLEKGIESMNADIKDISVSILSKEAQIKALKKDKEAIDLVLIAKGGTVNVEQAAAIVALKEKGIIV